MKILILEDEEYRIKKFKENFIGCELFITHLPEMANKYLQEEEFDVIFLDHDLADEHYFHMQNPSPQEGTGLVTADFLGANIHLSPNAEIYIHSLNPVGAGRMRQACAKRNPVAIPFYNLFK